jgi:hypothetical protein
VLTRWNRIVPLVLCVVSAGFGIWSLTVGEYTTAALQLAFAVLWGLMAAFRDKWPSVTGRGRNGGGQR